MKPIKQTRLGSNGNCFEACIASLLECKIEDVPDLGAWEENSKWMRVLNDWLAEKGLGYVECRVIWDDFDTFFSDNDFYHVIIGPTSRSATVYHAVVGRKGTMVHDPHPMNIGILKEIDSLRIGVFVARCV